MPPDAATTGVQSPGRALEELDDLLEDLARLARAEIPPHEFHAALLDRTGRALAADAGAVWVRTTPGAWRCESRFDPTGEKWGERLADRKVFLDEIARGAVPRLFLPGASGPEELHNPTPFVLLAAPIVPEPGTVAAVVGILQQPGDSPAAQQGALRLLEAVCELAADFHRRRAVQTWRERAAIAREREQFVERLHADLDPQRVAVTLVNDVRALVRCDRASLVVFRHERPSVWATSGVEAVEGRSEFAHAAEELAAAGRDSTGTLWLDLECQAELVPPVAGAYAAWIEQTQAQRTALVPLRGQSEEAGADQAGEAHSVLLCEWFAPGAGVKDSESLEWLARQGGLSLGNALTHQDLPLSWLGRSLARSRLYRRLWRSPRAAAVALSVGIVLLVLSVVPADFTIGGQGTLQPEVRREVFARSDGIVTELKVDHGSPCQKDQVLAVLTRSQLDFEFTRVAGELQTTRTRLAGLLAARLESTPQTAAERERYQQQAAEEEELKEQLASLEKQQEILRSQQDDLLVRSPIDGQVITWNVRDLLTARPVQRGQALFTVAETQGSWVLEIEVPDDQIGHVLEAQQADPADLEVSFLLATDPSQAYRGRIEKVAQGTVVRPNEPAHVLVTVAFDRDQIPQLRPGATAIPHIHCGRRPLGYVWFHGVWEAIQRYVVF